MYAITWRYHDGSASGVVAVFDVEKDADELWSILIEHCTTREFKVQPVRHVKSAYAAEKQVGR